MTAGRFDLTGKTALLTGGSRGIGRGIALGLAEHGANVAIVYRSADDQAAQVVSAIQRMGRQAWSWREDLARTDRLGPLTDRVWQACGRIDILVNNAAISYLEAYDAITPEHWRQTLAVNLDAVFFLAQHVARKMVAARIKGRIINVSSTNGLVAEAGLAHYNASKGGLELLTRSLAIELGEYGITVNTIAPGLIDTEIHSGFELDPAFFEYAREHIPLEHRFGTVEECVGAAVFLASPAGSYVTGQHLVVDGGLICEQFPRLRFMKQGS